MGARPAGKLAEANQGAAMLARIGAGEILLVLAVLVLLFGARKLPELARSLGKSARELRKGMQEDAEESETVD
jgi:sec-independent protein translocase protein TatA